MRYLFFIIGLVFLIGCIQEPKEIKTLSPVFVEDFDTLGLRPQALRVIPGVSWILDNIDSLDLYEQMVLSQNNSTGRESRFTSTTLMNWIFSRAPDSLNLTQYLDNDTVYQTLSISNDSLFISDGNNVLLTAYLDNTDAQTLSFSNPDLSITGGNSVDLSSLSLIVNPVNVKDHGAVGDGVTDDTDSIQSALDTYGAILIPQGTFLVSQILIDSNNQSISGLGWDCIIKMDAGQDANKSPVRISGPAVANNYLENITLFNFAIDGGSREDANYDETTQNEGINGLGNTRNLTIDRVQVRYVGPDGIDIDDDNINLTITNCVIDSCGKSGMHLYGLVNAFVANNKISHCVDVGITLNGGATLTPQAPVFLENRIDSCGSGINMVTGNNITVKGNTITNTTGTTFSGLNGEGIVFGEVGTVTNASALQNKLYRIVNRGIIGRAAIVTGNAIDGATNGIAISSTGGAMRSVIEGNLLINLTGTQGIAATSPVAPTVSNNTIKTRGIVITADSAVIIGNRISNTTTQGISISGDNSIVVNNWIKSAGTQGIEIASGALNGIAQGNYIDGAVDNGIILSADNSVAVGNYIRNVTANGRASVNLNANNTHALYNIIESARAPLRSKAAITGFSLIGNRILSATHQSDILSLDGTIYGNVGDNSALAGIANRTIINSVTTTQRDALTGVNGMIIYNTTTNQMEAYENGVWVDL